MKLKNVLMISFLAIAGIFGASSAIVNNEVKETPVVEKAEAWIDSKFYLKGTFNNWYEGDNNYHLTYDYNGGDVQFYGTFNFDSSVAFTVIGRWDGDDGWSEFKPTPKTDESDTSPFYLDDTVQTRRSIRATIYFKRNTNLLYWTETNYSVAANSIDIEKGTVSVSSTSVNYKGTSTLTAEPNSGYSFLGWRISGGASDSYTSTANPYTLTNITNNLTYTAYFGSTSNITVFFDAGTDFGLYSNVYLYCTDAGGVPLSDWPGTKLSTTRTYSSFYGGNVYQASIPSDANIVIFNNGNNGVQTVNITSGWSNNSTYLVSSTATGTPRKSSGTWRTSYVATWVDGSTTNNYVYGGFATTLPDVATPAPTGYTAEWNEASGGGGTPHAIGSTYTFTGDKTFYRYNRIHEHTVTYHQNDENDKSYTTDPLNYDSSHTVLNINSTEISSWGGPSFLRKFLKWNTKSDGSGQDYLAGSSLTIPDEDVDLYSIQQWFTFYYSQDGGTTWHSMVTSSADGYLVQFNPSANIELTGGHSLKFKYIDGDSVTHFLDNGNIAWSGNYTYDAGQGIDKIIMSGEGKIYLKYDDDVSHSISCYVEGLTTYTIGITHNGVRDAFGMHKSEEPGKNEYVSLGYIYVRAGDQLERGYAGVYNDPYLGGGQGCFETREGHTYCTVTGAYIVYLVYSGVSTDYTDVYIGEVTSDARLHAARHYAQIFNLSIGGVCKMDGTTDFDDLFDAWYDDETGPDTIYNELDASTRALYSSSEDTDIALFRAKYNFILRKYGYGSKESGKLTDFMGTTPKGAIRNFSPFSMINGEDGGDNATTIIIIIAASVSLLSITALSILLVKKRKRVDN